MVAAMQLTAEEVRSRVSELVRARGEPGGDRSRIVEAALFVEEVFGLRLADEEMTEASLGREADICRIVLDHLGRR
jgi:hypothetical protein